MITFDIATKAAEQVTKRQIATHCTYNDPVSQLCIHTMALHICEGLRIGNYILRCVAFLDKKTIFNFTFPADYCLDPIPLKIALFAIQNLYGKESYFSKNDSGSFNVFLSSIPKLENTDCQIAALCIAVSTGDKEKILQAAKYANMNYPGPFGRTPLFFNLHCPITHRLLVSMGAASHTDQFGLSSEKFVEGMHREIRWNKDGL